MTDTPELRGAILAALPGTMPELAARAGVPRSRFFRELVVRMKWEGLLRRRLGTDVFERGAVQGRPPKESALPCPPGKGKKFAVLLVAVPGWPVQDPGRAMEHSRYKTGQDAVAAAQRMRQLYPRMKWTPARMRVHDLIRLTGAVRQREHPARAPGPADAAAVPQWLLDL